MNNDWWVHGQQYDAPNGSESFRRYSTVVYRKKDGDPSYYEVPVTEDRTAYGPGFAGGDFVFTDVKTGFSGRLTCTETTCTVYYDGPGTAYIVSPAPQGEQMERLSDFDHRQEPARIYTVRDTTQVIYLSRWVHGAKHQLDVLHWIDLAGGQTNVLFTGSLTDVSLRGGPREYQVDGSAHKLHLWPDANLDTGAWQQLGTNATLEAAPLSDYRIRHNDNSGVLMMLLPRG